jgi:hypothetical protein
MNSRLRKLRELKFSLDSIVRSPRRAILKFFLFSVRLSLSLRSKTLSLCFPYQLLFQSFQFFGALCCILGSFYTLNVLLIFIVCTHEEIAPAKGGGEIVHESHVVEIVMIGAGPEGENVLERPREVVSAMSIDGLEETESGPDVHGENVKVCCAEDVEDRSCDGSSTEDENLGWMGVFSSEAKGSRIFVVYLMYVFIHGTPMEELVGYETHEYKSLFAGKEKRIFAYRRSGTCLRKRRRARPEGQFLSK